MELSIDRQYCQNLRKTLPAVREYACHISNKQASIYIISETEVDFREKSRIGQHNVALFS